MKFTNNSTGSAPFSVNNRLVLAIAIPMTLAYITTPLIGVVGTAVIGRLGVPALLGGLAAGAIFFDVLFATFNSLRSGTTGLIAQAFGRNNQLEEQVIALRALFAAAILGLIIIAASGPLSAFGIWFINPAEDVRQAMHIYIDIRILAAPLTLINYVVLGYLLGRGEGSRGLAFQFLLNGMNTTLAIWLGLGKGWGLEGVAWASVGGELTAAIISLALLAYRFRRHQWPRLTQILEWEGICRMAALNRDIMIRSFALLTAFALLARQGAQLGTTTLAANAILLNFFFVAGYFLDGFATAAEQLAGRAFGAGQAFAFRQAVKLTALWGFALAVLSTLITFMVGEAVILALTTSPQVREIALAHLPWAALTPISGVLAFLMDGVFIGATWSRDMRNMMLLALAAFILGIFYVTAGFGNHGLWIAFHVFLILRGLSLLALLPMRIRYSLS